MCAHEAADQTVPKLGNKRFPDSNLMEHDRFFKHVEVDYR